MANSHPERLLKRLDSLDRVLQRLGEAVDIDGPSDLEVSGMVHLLEIAFELFWKSAQDALKITGALGEMGPRPALKDAAKLGYINDLETAFELKKARDRFSHQYAEDRVLDAPPLIAERYLPYLSDESRRLRRFTDG